MPKEIGGVMWKLLNNIWTNVGISNDWNKGTMPYFQERREKRRKELQRYNLNGQHTKYTQTF